MLYATRWGNFEGAFMTLNEHISNENATALVFTLFFSACVYHGRLFHILYHMRD